MTGAPPVSGLLDSLCPQPVDQDSSRSVSLMGQALPVSSQLSFRAVNCACQCFGMFSSPYSYSGLGLPNVLLSMAIQVQGYFPKGC